MSYSSYIIGCLPEKLDVVLEKLKPKDSEEEESEYEYETKEVLTTPDSDFFIIYKSLNPEWKYIAIHEHCAWADDIYKCLVEECGKDEFLFAKTTF